MKESSVITSHIENKEEEGGGGSNSMPIITVLDTLSDKVSVLGDNTMLPPPPSNTSSSNDGPSESTCKTAYLCVVREVVQRHVIRILKIIKCPLIYSTSLSNNPWNICI